MYNFKLSTNSPISYRSGEVSLQHYHRDRRRAQEEADLPIELEMEENEAYAAFKFKQPLQQLEQPEENDYI